MVTEVLWCVTVVWVVLVILTVVLVVELLRSLLGLMLGLLTVEVVLALGLGESVDLNTSEASDELLGELVRDWLAYFDGVVSKACVSKV